jgi:PAS domain S-box-containing protein
MKTEQPGSLVIKLAILTVFIISILDFFGRATNLPLLDRFSELHITMKVITSICFILSATALTFVQKGTKNKSDEFIPKFSGLIIFIAGLLTVFVYLFLFITGKEAGFIHGAFFKTFLVDENRMSLFTAINFILISIVIFLLAMRRVSASNLAHFIVIPAAIISYLVPVSYILGVEDLHKFLKMPVALNSGIAFCAVCLAVFFMRPHTWLMKVFNGTFSGSKMARRLVPAVFLLPLVIGWLRIYGEHAGIFNSEIGVMLVALTYTTCFLGFIWFTARAVNRQDLRRWKYEKELAASESNLKAILDATKESVYMFDRQGIFLTANLTGAQRLRFPVNEIIGRHFSEFMQEELAKSRLEKMNSVFETGLPLQFDDERDGMIFRHNFYPVFENGRITRIVTYSRDITEHHMMDEELKMRELKFRNVFENSNDAIMITDIETGKYIDCNRMSETMTGYSRHEILSMKAGSLLTSSGKEESRIYIERLRTGEGVRSETEIISKDSKIIPVEFNASVIEIDKKPCIVSLMRNISERKIAEEQLKKYAVDLKQLNATKDKFFRIIAHDLKNPFSSLLGASELLSKNAEIFSLEKIKSYSTILNSSARSGYELLENLLEWSKTQIGDIEFRPDTINLKDIVERNLLSLKISAVNKEIQLVSEITADFELTADKNMIDAVIRNLISNAIKFTPLKGVISITACKTDAFAIITVKDNGIGISKENIEKLFKIDTKFVNIGTANERGTGLGLILCKEFVEKHGGKIWVESELGAGSAFKFNLPLIHLPLYIEYKIQSSKFKIQNS